VKLVGEARLRAHLMRIRLEAIAAEPAAENAMARVVAGRARNFAPRRTGKLVASIRAEGSQAKADISYARFQEFGTQFVTAQHFLKRAAEAHKEIAAATIPVFRAAIR
jgi:HK97 gp10 family phage protein